MKLLNFRAHDPHHDTKGLSRGNKLESVIWAEFSGNHPVLKQVVAAILGMASIATSDDTSILLDDFTEAQEGRLLTRLHSYRERSVSIVRQKKKDYRKKHGHLRCEACGFDFQATYGKRGEGFIECHHTKPVSQLVIGETTSLAELVLLCANCHRMIHSARPWWTIEELRAAIT